MTWVEAAQAVKVQAVMCQSNLDFYFHQRIKTDLRFASCPPLSWATLRHQSCWHFSQNLSTHFPCIAVQYGLSHSSWVWSCSGVRVWCVIKPDAKWVGSAFTAAHQLRTYSKDTVHLPCKLTVISVCNDFARVPFNFQSLVHNSVSWADSQKVANFWW